jgi:hypothetical protein
MLEILSERVLKSALTDGYRLENDNWLFLRHDVVAANRLTVRSKSQQN